MLFSGSKFFDRLASARKNLFGNSFSHGGRSSRPDYLRRYALSIEPLETRRVLSVVGLDLDITFYEDNDGVIGNEITSGNIEPGEAFFVEISAEDIRESFTEKGIIGLTIDVSWDTSSLEEIDNSALFTTPLDSTSLLVTTDFPLDRGATLNSGEIDNLTGRCDPNITDGGVKIGSGGLEQFSVLHFQALTTFGDTIITVYSESVSFVDGDSTVYDSATAAETISIEVTNLPPTASDLFITDADENTAITDGSLVSSVSAPDAGGSHTFSGPTTSTLGASVTVNSDGSFTYDPIDVQALQNVPVGSTVTDTFTYTVTDESNQTDTATVTITVSGVDNDVPFLEIDGPTGIKENLPITIDLRQYIKDWETADADLTFTVKDNPTNGTVEQNGNEVTFTPTTDFTGTASFKVDVTDLASGSAAAQTTELTIVFAVNNTAPVLDTSTIQVNKNSYIEFDLRDYVTDAETADANLTFDLGGASGGAFAIFDGHMGRFTPNSDYTGAASFSFTVKDVSTGPQEPHTESFTINVDIVVENTAPTAEGSLDISTTEDTAISIDLRELVTDAETPDDQLTFVLSDTYNANGQAVLQNDGYTVIFTPTDDDSYTTSFKFTVTDTAVSTIDPNSVEMTVNVEVTPVNDAPVAEGTASFTTNEDTQKTIDLRTLVDDMETADDDLTFILTNDADGQAVLNGHTVIFTPSDDSNGTVQFSFKATDEDDAYVERTVEVDVTPINDTPEAEGTASFTTTEDTQKTIDLRTLVDDVETADDDLTFILTNDADGQAVLDGHTVTFTPSADSNGTVQFSFKATDEDDAYVERTVEVDVTPINDTPEAEGTASFTTTEDTQKTIDLRTLVNDVETADDDLTFILTNDADGQAVLDGHTVTFTPSADSNGTVQFSFKATDEDDAYIERTVEVDVTPINDAPEADATLSILTDEDTAVPIDLWDYISDLETADADLTFVLTDSADGQAAMQTDHHIVIFTPTANSNGQVTFKFSVQDEATSPETPEQVEFTFTVDVQAINDDPVAVDDTAVTNTTTTIDTSSSTFNHGVLENDSDVDGDTITITASDTTSAEGAAVTVNSDGSYTYDPRGVTAFSSLNPGESKSDSFSYTISDPSGATSTATVTVTVYATATQAVALDDTAATDEDTIATGNVLENDQIASTGLTLSMNGFDTTSANGAAVSIDANGNFTYNPTGVAALQALAAGETITDTFTYTIKDANNNEDTATVTITLTGVNDGPTAVNDTKTVNANTISSGNVLTNDTDPDTSDVLTVVPETGVTAKGAAFVMTANGSFQYDPTGVTEFTSPSSGQITDTFTYTINDGHGGTSTATVTLTVNCVNDSPDAVDDTAATDGDDTATGNVLDNDTDPDTGDSLHVSTFDATSSKGATVTINSDGSFTYDPSTSTTLKELAVGETTTDTFTYTAMDSGGKISTATVTITVTGVDDAPTAGDDTGSTTEDTSTNGNLFTNDVEHDPEDSFSLKSFDAISAKGATVTVDANGNYTYDPSDSTELNALAKDETTTDTFTYTIKDEQGNETTATVTITITGVNDESTAVNDTASTNKDMSVTGNVLDNDTDPDTDDTLTVTAFDATSSKGASVTVNSDGSFTYNPTGSSTLQALAAGTTTTDTFTYTMDDGHGNTQTATVTVTVSGDEGTPIANDDSDSTDENTSLTGNVLDNDQVPNGRTITVSDYDTTSAQGATITMQDDGSYTYNPANSTTLNALGANQSLNDTFTYTIKDNTGKTSTATVTITVSGIADAPVVSINTGETVASGETVTIEKDALRTTDADSAAADLVYELTAIPTHGTLKRDGVTLAVGDTFTQADIDSNLIKYTHNGDTATSDNFKFTVSDGTTTLNEATFNLNLSLNTLSGFVYMDIDNDGVKDSNEVGLGSVTVMLTGLDTSGNAVARSTWTAADGSYTFENIPDGTYEVSIVQPNNLVAGKEKAGSEGGTAADGRISSISLSSADDATHYNFGQEGLQPHMISLRMLMNSSPSRNVVYQQAVGSQKFTVTPQGNPTVNVQNKIVTVTGTAGDDSIEFHAGDTQHTLVVNDQYYYYNAADVTNFNFNTGAGIDFVTLYGTDGNEMATMSPGSATFIGDGLAVNVTEAERVLIDAAAGDDEITLYDSLGNDSLRANGKFAMLSGDDFANWAFNFEKGSAKSSAGKDTSDVGTLTDLVLTKEGSWTEL